MIAQKQITLGEIYADCQKILEEDKPAFLSLLEEHINLESYIPQTFWKHFYKTIGRDRKYALQGFMWALLIQKIFSIPTDTLLLNILVYSKLLREFCGFTKVPDASKITRFKQDFIEEIQSVFERLVDITEPICQELDAVKAEMTIFDTSGYEAYVTENNPKYFNRILQQMENWAKVKNLDKSFDPYKAAYSAMPSCASKNPEIKQQYLNGHFCYAYKFGTVTNGLGIIRHIDFYNQDFFKRHPEIVIEKKSDSPDEDKSVGDSRLLMPTLKEFFVAHPLIAPKTFLGDSAFDAIQIYKDLLTGDTFGIDALGEGKHFSKAYIPLNSRSKLENADYTINESGHPCCPHDSSLPMKPEGNTSHLRCKIPTFKFVCPKMKWLKCDDGKYRRRTLCENPCTSSLCGRMVYIYPEKDLRAFPGVIRDTPQWNDTYKIRATVEQTLNHFKNNLCIADRKTHNDKTIFADLLFAGITQLISVVLADKIHRSDCFRSLKKLIA